MIKNARQYRITVAQIKKFRQAIAELKKAPASGTHPMLVKAQREALESQLADLSAEAAEYESLSSGNQRKLQLASLEELPRAIIRARIARGLTQKQLAREVGLKEQQIQRYEASEYAKASFERIKQITDALKIRIREEVILGEP